MLRGRDVNDITELKRQGLSVSQISAVTGFDRKTVRKYLDDPERPEYGPRIRPANKLDPFKPYIQQRLAQGAWNAVVLFAEIKTQGYTGGMTMLRMFLHPLRREASSVAVRRFETPPGHQAQVDWGELGKIETPSGQKTLHAFVFTLGHSRAMFADIATDTKLETLIRLHESAFAELGGIPREILYDRMKTVVSGMDDRGETQFHPVFLDFANYWGFTPRACRAYRPQTKGKVENGVGYIRKNFLCGREATGLDDARLQLRSWLWKVANQRIHGTTKRQILQHWLEEKPLLLPAMGRSRFPFVPDESRKVSRDAFVSYRGNRYSAPWRVAGQEVLLQEVQGHLHILRAGERLAVHALASPGSQQTVMIAAHHEGIPLDGTNRGGKAKIRISASESAVPVVEVRSLQSYETEVSNG